MSDKPIEAMFQLPMFTVADFRVRTYQLPESVRAWMESDQDSSLNSIELLQKFSRNGLLLRMSLDFSVPMVGETSQSFLGDLPESFQKFLRRVGEMQEPQEGRSTMSPIAFSIRSISEWPSAAAVCSLSDILETGVPPKYFLSPKAARGILSRAERRGKALPEHLKAALENAAIPTQATGTVGD